MELKKWSLGMEVRNVYGLEIPKCTSRRHTWNGKENLRFCKDCGIQIEVTRRGM